jgi:hypothetical protein
MALLSFADSPHGGSLKLLPEWQNQGKITPTTIIDHSIVGSAAGAFFYFRDKTGIESHFIVGLDGVIWQLMDTGRRADANLNANDFGISIETADNGDPNNFPWTRAQLDSLKWLHNKLRAVHPTIPRKKVTSCSGGGLGYHSLCPTTSSNPWTPSAGKTCPGTIRKKQWTEILVPAFVSGETEEDDLTEAEHDALMWLRQNAVSLRDQGVRMTATGDPDVSAERETNNLANVLAELKGLRQDLSVSGSAGLADTVEDFATRQRQILSALEDIQGALPIPPQP